MANPILKKRTIQSPGFEFFETDLSIYKEYRQDTDALVVGYFAKGPILTPQKLENMSDYTVYFGKPEDEMEIYAYKGIERIIGAGGTVTALRLPYFNTVCPSITNGKANVVYRALVGSLTDVTNTYTDIEEAFATKPEFKNINWTVKSLSEDEVIKVKSGVGDTDFAIVNKFHDYLTKKGEEIFVTVLGAGNVVRYQGLTEDSDTEPTAIPVFADGQFDTAATNKLTIGRDPLLWQSSRTLDEVTQVPLRVDETYPEDILAYFPSLPTMYEEDILVPARGKISFSITRTSPLEEGAVYTVSEMDGTIVATEENNSDFDSAVFLKGAIIYDKAKDGTIAAFLKLSNGDEVQLSEDTETEGSYIYTGEFAAKEAKKVDGVKIDPRRDDFITVIVSKITPSITESGKFNISIVESFNGSIFADSIDSVSQESNYIGDLINNSSNFIFFYGKSNYGEEYSKEKNVILVENQEAWRLSWAEGSAIFSGDTSNDTVELTKYIAPVSSQGGRGFETTEAKDLVIPALNKVKNNIVYTFRDVYDFGTSSVLAYYNANDGLYNPVSGVDPVAISSKDTPITAWKRVANAFANFCRYKHKLSMVHCAGPRKLVLEGNLSRVEDLAVDPLEIVFNPKLMAKLAIKDSSYIETNLEWGETSDEFNKRMMWAPINISLAGSITGNDINRNVWDAPAGAKYAPITGFTRLAFNPELEVRDRIYINCLNYAMSWPSGIMTIEGQKTGYSENSALNRVNVRRLMIWLERYTQTVASTYIYEPNNSQTRENFVAELNIEFDRVLNLGGLYGKRIVCDEENNPPEVIDRNELRLSVFVQPTKTVEYVIGNFTIAKTGANLEELSAAF